jgi:hypothetical protein
LVVVEKIENFIGCALKPGFYPPVLSSFQILNRKVRVNPGEIEGMDGFQMEATITKGNCDDKAVPP